MPCPRRFSPVILLTEFVQPCLGAPTFMQRNCSKNESALLVVLLLMTHPQDPLHPEDHANPSHRGSAGLHCRFGWPIPRYPRSVSLGCCLSGMTLKWHAHAARDGSALREPTMCSTMSWPVAVASQHLDPSQSWRADVAGSPYALYGRRWTANTPTNRPKTRLASLDSAASPAAAPLDSL
jgi:hypothetical protein